jgi:hypothetical protein
MNRAAIILFVIMLLTGCNATPASSDAALKVAAPNHSPVIDDVVLEYISIERGGSGQIRCIAHDLDGDRLTYKWEVDRGNISGNGANVTYTAPNSFANITLNVFVSDGRGGWAQKAAAFKVVCCGYAQKNVDWERKTGKKR